MMQQLLSRASVLPSLLERYDEIKSLLEITSLSVVQQLYQDFQVVLKSLQQWELITTNAHFPLVWSGNDSGNHPSPSIANVLWFPNIMTANSLTHYWAFKIIAKMHLSSLERALTTSKARSFHAVSEPNIEDSVADLAEMICDSMAYLIQPDVALHHAGSSFFTFPTAVGVFQKEPNRYRLQLLRCRDIVDQLESKGIHFIRV
jgi:hypothetical protein